jgi:hypothetical protein
MRPSTALGSRKGGTPVGESNVSHIIIARQRLGKNIPEVTVSTIGHPLLGNEAINAFHS